MRKPERTKLAERLRELLTRYGGSEVIQGDIGGVPHSLRTELTGSYGGVSVTAYLPRDARDSPWLACSFRDWDAEFPNPWHGFNHWKQNLLGTTSTAEEWPTHVIAHLAKLGIKPPKLYDLYRIKCDGDGVELSREVVGSGKWQPMTHAEAVTARDKFTTRKNYRFELVEVAS